MPALRWERIAAARSAIDAGGGDTLLVARSECYLTGHPSPRSEAISRLTKFAAAGADCLFAPGVRTRATTSRPSSRRVAPKPVNVLVGWAGDLTVAGLGELGVRRISVGGALARMAWAGVQRAAEEIAEAGSFAAFAEAAPGDPLNQFFAADARRRVP